MLEDNQPEVLLSASSTDNVHMSPLEQPDADLKNMHGLAANSVSTPLRKKRIARTFVLHVSHFARWLRGRHTNTELVHRGSDSDTRVVMLVKVRYPRHVLGDRCSR